MFTNWTLEGTIRALMVLDVKQLNCRDLKEKLQTLENLEHKNLKALCESCSPPAAVLQSLPPAWFSAAAVAFASKLCAIRTLAAAYYTQCNSSQMTAARAAHPSSRAHPLVAAVAAHISSLHGGWDLCALSRWLKGARASRERARASGAPSISAESWFGAA